MIINPFVLFLVCRHKYIKDLEDRISSELEACFAVGLSVMGEEMVKLPATLLADDTAREYCMAFENLHGEL